MKASGTALFPGGRDEKEITIDGRRFLFRQPADSE